MELIDANKLSKQQYKELIEGLGGKYSLIQRIKMGGTGVGGLFLISGEQEQLDLRYKSATETVKVSIERLKQGIIIGLNNTKEIKLMPFFNPNIEWAIINRLDSKSHKEQLRLKLIVDKYTLFLYTSGWNNKEVLHYFKQLAKAF